MFFPPKRAGGETQEFDTTDRNTALDRREPAESARRVHFEDRLEVFEVRVLGKKLTGEKKKKYIVRKFTICIRQLWLR